MQRYEKIANSKIFRFLENLYKLIVLNMVTFLTIVLGLGLTLLPALSSLIVVLRSIKKGEEVPILEIYFYSFKKNFKKAFLTQIPFLLFFVLYIFNIYYFYQMIQEYQGLYNEIAYYVSLVVIAIALVALINCAFVLVYFPHLNKRKTIKYSITLLRVIALKVIIMFVLLIGFIYLTILIVFALPIILISLYLYLYLSLVHIDYTRLLPDGYSSIEAIVYLDDIRSKREKKKNRK